MLCGVALELQVWQSRVPDPKEDQFKSMCFAIERTLKYLRDPNDSESAEYIERILMAARDCTPDTREAKLRELVELMKKRRDHYDSVSNGTNVTFCCLRNICESVREELEAILEGKG